MKPLAERMTVRRRTTARLGQHFDQIKVASRVVGIHNDLHMITSGHHATEGIVDLELATAHNRLASIPGHDRR
jgi:hypothetical protein